MKIKLNSRIKFSLAFLGIYILIMIFAESIIGIYSYNVVRGQADSYLYSSGSTKASHIRTFITDQETTAKILAAASIFRDFIATPNDVAIKNKINQRFERTLQVDQNIVEVFIVDSRGIVIGSSDVSQEGKDISQDQLFNKSQKDVYFKDVYFSQKSDMLVYSVSAPVIDETTNTFLGESVIVYNPKNFYSVVAAGDGLGKSEESFLINSSKYFLTPSHFLGDAVILNRKVQTKSSDDCFSQREIDYVGKFGYSGLNDQEPNYFTSENDYRGVGVISTHYYIPETGWCLISKVDSSDLLSSNINLILIISVVFGSSMLMFMAATYLASKRINKPIIKLKEYAERLRQGDLEGFVLSGDNENDMSELSQTMNDISKAISSSRSEVDKKVEEQNKEILKKDEALETRQRAITNVLEDIKDEKDKAVALTEELKKFELAVAGASDHIVITDPNGIILYMNDAAAEITGFSIKESIGKKSGSPELWGGQMPKDFYIDFWNTIKVKKRSFQGIFSNIRKGGQKYEAANTVTPILGQDGEVRYFVDIGRDVTREQQIDKAKTEFVSLASHQLRTPLSAINWYAEMLIDGDAGKLNKEQMDYLSQVYNNNQRMVDLVNSLLNVSRLDLGTFAIEPEKMDIIKIAKDVIKELVPIITRKRQNITEIYQPNLPLINADPKLARIIFQNLLSNSIKYTNAKGKISISIKIKNEKYIEIKVTDNGMGIPALQQDKIFTKLFRADNVKATDTEGTGLGLYIVKSIVENAGGKIGFVSEENKGTTFTVDLPRSGMKEKKGTKKLE